MTQFLQVKPTVENRWRALILLGRNTASYKFALGRALLELKETPGDLLKLDDLALPFAMSLCEHVKTSPKQGARSINRDLKTACEQYNSGTLNADKLRDVTVRHGFGDVIDAFHVLGGKSLEEKFFIDERETSKGIRLTEHLRKLTEVKHPNDLIEETEARWKVVEAGWELGMNPSLIEYQRDTGNLTIRNSDRRISLKSCRSTLNGYQKGHCFYCFAPISVESGPELADVDHFFPWSLQQQLPNVDQIWNLVLSCTSCNRGVAGKFDAIPDKKLLERLHERNEYYIASQHRLAGTLEHQTGKTFTKRISFLQSVFDTAIQYSIQTWRPTKRGEATF